MKADGFDAIYTDSSRNTTVICFGWGIWIETPADSGASTEAIRCPHRVGVMARLAATSRHDAHDRRQTLAQTVPDMQRDLPCAVRSANSRASLKGK
jgi:hypothetical protein